MIVIQYAEPGMVSFSLFTLATTMYGSDHRLWVFLKVPELGIPPKILSYAIVLPNIHIFQNNFRAVILDLPQIVNKSLLILRCLIQVSHLITEFSYVFLSLPK